MCATHEYATQPSSRENGKQNPHWASFDSLWKIGPNRYSFCLLHTLALDLVSWPIFNVVQGSLTWTRMLSRLWCIQIGHIASIIHLKRGTVAGYCRSVGKTTTYLPIVAQRSILDGQIVKFLKVTFSMLVYKKIRKMLRKEWYHTPITIYTRLDIRSKPAGKTTNAIVTLNNPPWRFLLISFQCASISDICHHIRCTL